MEKTFAKMHQDTQISIKIGSWVRWQTWTPTSVQTQVPTGQNSDRTMNPKRLKKLVKPRDTSNDGCTNQLFIILLAGGR